MMFDKTTVNFNFSVVDTLSVARVKGRQVLFEIDLVLFDGQI